MNMEEFVLEKINGRIGRQNAITMELILYLLYGHGIINAKGGNENRRIRRIIEKYPTIHSCEDGYYMAREGEKGKEDVDYAIKYLNNKAMPIHLKIKRKKEAFPQFYGNDQQQLFTEEEKGNFFFREGFPHED